MQFSQPLPPALRGDKSKLSPSARQRLDSLNGRSPKAFFMQLSAAWLVILAAAAVAASIDNPWLTALAVLLIATRQNVLALLIHDQAHCLALKAKPGDLLVNLLAAYPLLLVTVEGYAQVHLAHHRFYFSDQDPDILRKTGPEWTFPMPVGKLLKLFASDLLGLNLIKLIKGKRAAGDYGKFKRPSQLSGWLRPAYLLLLAAILTWSGGWWLFLIYWLLPLLTVFQVIVRIGALCEHQYIPGQGVVETSPVIELYWWERLLLPNLNFNLHPYHHFCPGIPFDKLPQAHAIFRREGLIDEANVFKGYAAYFRYLVTGNNSG